MPQIENIIIFSLLFWFSIAFVCVVIFNIGGGLIYWIEETKLLTNWNSFILKEVTLLSQIKTYIQNTWIELQKSI